MHDENAPPPAPAELNSIEFQSPGRFAVHNPESFSNDPAQAEPAPFTLGQHLPMERFSNLELVRAHCLALLQQARRTLCLYSHELEPWLLNHSSVEQACSDFLRAHPRNQLRILLRDSSRAVHDGHRLLQLNKRLSSNFHIRKLHPDYPSEEISFLLADRSGLLVLPQPSRAEGYALYQDGVRNRQRQEQFDRAWETSLSDSNLRSFLL
ncbi:histone acetyltransferase HPA2 [Pseudomonas sp. 5P_3.1_Bac2]|uniref:DUF7931 domain-containing protein n=1 Tax=Pseudomonas sp. 5P_3.1_Bac2 TaxID=2971617 RepID=UPI0021CAD67E|nr:histone acetyltransferase HPA2 [Pseudomonas sp. 5P_3.1_Bac2]MCU1717029.1 histone acetyltransferase HPA2 [Pseudomonas sp. 5P_3.1_Bac2]